jgi:hypothetical protein
MQVTVTVSDVIVREAGVRGLPVIDFVESLIDKGMSAAQGRPVLDSAMERIRALRAASVGSKNHEWAHPCADALDSASGLD